MPTNTFDLEVFLKALVMPEDTFRLDRCERIDEKDTVGFYAHFVPDTSTTPAVAGLEIEVEALWRAEHRILRLSNYLDLSAIDTDTDEEIQQLLFTINNCNATLDVSSKVFVTDQDEGIVGTVTTSLIIPAEFDTCPEIQQGLNILAGHSIMKLITDMAVVTMYIIKKMNLEDEEESRSRLQ